VPTTHSVHIVLLLALTFVAISKIVPRLSEAKGVLEQANP